jgi:hypothetical protein
VGARCQRPSCAVLQARVVPIKKQQKTKCDAVLSRFPPFLSEKYTVSCTET